jgi:ascorbate-specific PTS system EIIC-type component UlaA
VGLANAAFARVTYSLVVLAMVTCIFLIGPFIAGCIMAFMVGMLSASPLGKEAYLSVWLVVFVVTTLLSCYAEYRTNFTSKTLDRIAAGLGIQFKRKGKNEEKNGNYG